MTEIYQYPVEWYQFTKVSFQLRSASQTSPRPWAGGNSIYGPHVQMWMPKLTVSTQDVDTWPAMDAFFSRLGGQAGLIRIGDVSRLDTQYNRSLAASASYWTDGTSFTYGSGFLSGLLPPVCYVVASASRGDKYIIMGGLPASIPRALRRGDLFELRPNGIPSATPNLYQIMVDAATNTSGMAGVEIRPPLRMGFAVGDVVILKNPTSVFHLIDDSQAEMSITAPMLADFGFSLIEAIENVRGPSGTGTASFVAPSAHPTYFFLGF